jgi:hypothetical protein
MTGPDPIWEPALGRVPDATMAAVGRIGKRPSCDVRAPFGASARGAGCAIATVIALKASGPFERAGN